MTIMTTMAKGVAVAALLAACAPTPREVATRDATDGTAFQAALHEEYTQLALKERRLADWIDAYHFADKAADAADGKLVAPAQPTDDFWDIPEDQIPELESARARTINYILANRDTQPRQAATLQAAYDCWVEELEEGHQKRAIAACKTAWYNLASQYDAADARIATLTPQYVAVLRPAAYRVFFGFDKAALDANDKKMLDDAAAYIKANKLGDVNVLGHTDRSGDQTYNRKLSMERAENVANYLESKGVKAHIIDPFALGETEPLVRTGDGVRAPANRRVVIDVRDDS